LRPGLRRRRRPAARCHVPDLRGDAGIPLRLLLAGGVRLRDLHEGREELLSENPLRLAVLDLSRLRRRDHRPLSVPVLERAARTGARRVRPHAGGVRGMNLASPFSISIVAITLLAFLGLPVGHAMIAGSILY